MGTRVVLADDHAVVRDGLRMVLESRPDLEVVGEAADGRTALRLIHELRPDIVVMDIAMPGLNGIEATRSVTGGSSPTRVIILSMHGQTEFIFRALQAGAHGYLIKESVATEVVDAIRTVREGRRYLSSSISERVIEDYIRSREAPRQDDPLLRLSSREREVLQLVVEGRSNAAIAEAASLSPKTIETYRSRMMRKLEIESFPELVKFAIKNGLTTLDS